MSSEVAVQPFSGRYELDRIHSSFAFVVRHNSVATFRGTLSDVDAWLEAGDDGIVLEGAAKVESISILEPEQFRAHVLGPEFFDAERHPEVRFRSTDVRLDEDGGATVEGELTIKGITRSVTANGGYTAPRIGIAGKPVGALELHTTFDRRDFGFDWQFELPNGGLTLDWEVALEIQLELAEA